MITNSKTDHNHTGFHGCTLPVPPVTCTLQNINNLHV